MFLCDCSISNQIINRFFQRSDYNNYLLKAGIKNVFSWVTKNMSMYTFSAKYTPPKVTYFPHKRFKEGVKQHRKQCSS
jgi:hypothetical protein